MGGSFRLPVQHGAAEIGQGLLDEAIEAHLLALRIAAWPAVRNDPVRVAFPELLIGGDEAGGGMEDGAFRTHHVAVLSDLPAPHRQDPGGAAPDPRSALALPGARRPPLPA